MPSVQFRRFEQILEQILARTVARSALTGVDDSSGWKHLAAAVAREIEDVHFRMADVLDAFSILTSSGKDLDRRAAEIYGAPDRRLLSYAVSTVVFSRAVASASAVVVPAATIVKTAGKVEFVTQASTTIPSLGTAAPPVAVRAVRGGVDGNVGADTVTQFTTKPTGVDAVTNNTAGVLGADVEDDDSFRARILEYLESTGKSTRLGLRFAARSALLGDGSRVVFAHVFRDPINRGEVIVYVDDGSGTIEQTAAAVGVAVITATGGERYASLPNRPIRGASPITITSSTRGVLTAGTQYVLDLARGQLYFPTVLVVGEVITASYSYFTGLIAEAQRIITGDENDEVNYPGFEAAGDYVLVLPPTVLQVSLAGELSILSGFTQSVVVAQAAEAAQDYVNSLGIGADVIVSELIERIMATPGVYNCKLTLPPSDVVVLDDQLPRLITANTNLIG